MGGGWSYTINTKYWFLLIKLKCDKLNTQLVIIVIFQVFLYVNVNHKTYVFYFVSVRFLEKNNCDISLNFETAKQNVLKSCKRFKIIVIIVKRYQNCSFIPFPKIQDVILKF